MGSEGKGAKPEDTPDLCVLANAHMYGCTHAHTPTHPHGYLHMGKLELRPPWLFSKHVTK